jgi:hypothetical protein
MGATMTMPRDSTFWRRLLKPAKLVSAGLAVLIAGGFVLFAAGAAQAQQAQKPSPQDELFMFFYKDPRPERLVGFLEQYDSAQAQKWDAYPPVAGFFTFIFRAHPTRIEQLVPARLNPQSATTVAAALRMSGNQAVTAKLQPKLEQAGKDEKLTAEFANLPVRLEDLSIRSSTHLDILWGAAYASGDARFVRTILDFFAQVANSSEPVAIDIAKVALGMAGGPKEIFGELRGRYGSNAVLIIVAAAAVWAAQSNAAQHPFVDRALAAYINEHPGTHATKVISAFRPKSKTP